MSGNLRILVENRGLNQNSSTEISLVTISTHLALTGGGSALLQLNPKKSIKVARSKVQSGDQSKMKLIGLFSFVYAVATLIPLHFLGVIELVGLWKVVYFLNTLTE